MAVFSRWSLETFRNVVFGHNSNSHHDPLIVSFSLFIFVISKVFLIFSIDNRPRPIMCHVTLSMTSSSRKWQHFLGSHFFRNILTANFFPAQMNR